MPEPEAVERYTTTAIVLHWLIAVAVVAMLVLGWWMVTIPKDPPGARLKAFNLHKSIGITVFLVMLARLGWRLTHRPPPLPPMPSWQARAARGVHALFYVALLAMPLAGFMASSFSGRPIVYFGFPLPMWAAKSEAVSSVFYGLHFAISWVLIAAIALHTMAAIKHQWIDRDHLLRRMWWRRADAPSLPSRSLQ